MVSEEVTYKNEEKIIDETQSNDTAEVFKRLLNTIYKPMVIDADALNIISENYKMRQNIPKGSILTPHLGELARLVGEWHSE